MSRTTLCVATAAALAVVSVAWMFTRHHVLGNQVKVPTGADTWKVTLSVQGKSTGDAKLITATPLDFGHQHVLREICRSEQLLHKPPAAQHPERREVLWTQRARVPNGPFRIRSEFYCRVNVSQPSAPMSQLAKQLYASPGRGAHLQSEPTVESDHPQIAALARRLTTGRDRATDQAEALFHFVSDEIDNEPRLSGAAAGAVECLKHGSGDASAKSRLLVALLRNREIPARLVTGLTLAKGREQATHVWVEAWLRDQWLPMCSFYHHYGRLPHTYLVFGFGDLRMVQARNARNVAYGFLVERWTPDAAAGSEGSWLHGLMLRLSFHTLPPPEQRLVEFLLLLPIAALIVCIFRNLIGIGSFGTFAPALLGLAFHELASLPGILVFVSILLIGWLMRRVLDRYHLLQVPRTAFLLSLVIIVLIVAVVGANYSGLPTTKYVSLFPMVILTGMIERFWTLEIEDGTASSFRTLLGTIVIATSIGLVLSLHALVRHMYRYPETLGVIMAGQLLIGRYTGYRLLELYRFRDFLRESEANREQVILSYRGPAPGRRF